MNARRRAIVWVTCAGIGILVAISIMRRSHVAEKANEVTTENRPRIEIEEPLLNFDIGNRPKEFQATVMSVRMARANQNSNAVIVSSDARWIVDLKIIESDNKEDVGAIARFAIHSPTLLFHSSSESAVGKDFNFKLNFTDGRPKLEVKFSELSD
jgi:hypothetical protein